MREGADGPSEAARRARGAVAALFFVNGGIFASVVPRYPDLKDQLSLSNAGLGTAVSAFWLGALVVGLGAGAVIGRWGSARVAWVVTVAAASNLVLVGVVPSWWALASVLFVAGSLDAVADVAENAHALRVEGLYRRSILNSLHAVWSIGAVVGGGAGAAAAGLQVPLRWHLPAAAVLFGALAVVVSRSLLPGPDERHPHPPAARTPATTAETPPPTGGWTGWRRALGAHRRTGLVVLTLGSVATLAQAIEDTGATWSALYLRADLGAAPALAGTAFVALQTLQTVGRLVGDRAVTRYGDSAVARAGAGMAGLAIATALAFPAPVTTVVAFGVAGLGIATLIPAAMRTAEGLPGLPPGAGLTVVGSVARLGSLGAPPLVGLVADSSSLRVALVLVPVAAGVLVLLAPALHQRPSPQRRPDP